MVLYISIISILLIMVVLQLAEIGSRKFWNIMYFIGAVFFILFAGLRYGIDTDYWTYLNMFNTGAGANDIGFRTLIYFFKKFVSIDFNEFVFFLAAVSIGIKMFCFSKYKRPVLALFVYISFFYILLEWNVIRQGLAVSILFMSESFIEKKKFFLFAVLVIFAATIHPIAILFLPMYFIKNITADVRAVLILIMAATVIRIALFPALTAISSYMHEYFQEGVMRVVSGHLYYYFSQGTGSLITVGYFRKFITLFLFIFLNQNRKIKNGYFNGYLTGYLLYILFMGNETLSVRISLTYDIFLIPLFGDYDFKLTNRSVLCIGTMLIMSVLIFIYALLHSASVPYQSFAF